MSSEFRHLGDYKSKFNEDLRRTYESGRKSLNEALIIPKGAVASGLELGKYVMAYSKIGDNRTGVV